jgi:FdhD protein
MSTRDSTKSHQAFRSKGEILEPMPLELLTEEPLLIRIDDKPYSVVMRTPGEEVPHAAGFCLGEGIADSPDDFRKIGYNQEQDPNVIDIWLKPERSEKVPGILERRRFVSQTSCGICGKELIDDLYQELSPAKDDFAIEIDRIPACLDKLDERQEYHKVTRSAHAALILDDRLEEISFAEDVGRHNALDKAIGKAFMNRKLSTARIAVLSSRTSYELVQKAARARLSMILSISRPTALAVEMCEDLNLTLVFPGKSELIIACGENRIKRKQ